MNPTLPFDPSVLAWMIPLVICLMIWEGVWKAIALWKCGRNNQLGWFIAILLLNTVGILPIVYIKFYAKNRSTK